MMRFTQFTDVFVDVFVDVFAVLRYFFPMSFGTIVCVCHYLLWSVWKQWRQRVPTNNRMVGARVKVQRRRQKHIDQLTLKKLRRDIPIMKQQLSQILDQITSVYEQNLKIHNNSPSSSNNSRVYMMRIQSSAKASNVSTTRNI